MVVFLGMSLLREKQNPDPRLSGLPPQGEFPDPVLRQGAHREWHSRTLIEKQRIERAVASRWRRFGLREQTLGFMRASPLNPGRRKACLCACGLSHLRRGFAVCLRGISGSCLQSSGRNGVSAPQPTLEPLRIRIRDPDTSHSTGSGKRNGIALNNCLPDLHRA